MIFPVPVFLTYTYFSRSSGEFSTTSVFIEAES